MEHDIGENVHHGVLYHIPLRNRLPCIGKDVKGGYSTQEQVWIQMGRLDEESSIFLVSRYILGKIEICIVT